MTGVLIGLVAFLAIALGVTSYYALSYKARRKQRGVFGSWPIRTVSLEELDPVFKPGAFGPGRQTEVRFVGQGSGIPGGTSDTEGWVLAVLATKAKSMFEFGTCTGKTTYLWARNAPASAKVVTITLAPDQVATYHGDSSDDARDTRHARKESAYETFYSSGTDVVRGAASPDSWPLHPAASSAIVPIVVSVLERVITPPPAVSAILRTRHRRPQ